MTDSAENLWRDFVTDMVPSSGAHDPDKAGIRTWGAYVEAGILGGAAGSAVFDSKSDMDAELDYAANTMAWVIGDATVANNGIYQKLLATGLGSWARLADLPNGFIRASNAGSGTASALVATTAVPIPAADGGALIALPIVADNTASPATVAFNGGTTLTIKSNSGNDIAVGGLTAGMIVAGYASGTTFRLLSDQANSAIVAAAETAQVAAEAAANDPNVIAVGENIADVTAAADNMAAIIAAPTHAANAATSASEAAASNAEVQELSAILEAVASPVQTFDGSNIGNMTANGGLAAAFDNVFVQTAAASAAAVGSSSANWVGKSFTAPRKISHVVVKGSSDHGFIDGHTGQCLISLYGKQGATAPATQTDGVLLATAPTFNDDLTVNSQQINIPDPTITYNHMWVRIQTGIGSSKAYTAELQIFEVTGTSVVPATKSEAEAGVENTKYLTALHGKEANVAQLIKHGVNSIRPAGSGWGLEAFNSDATVVGGGSESVDSTAMVAALASGERKLFIPAVTVKLAASNYSIPAGTVIEGVRGVSLLLCDDTALAGNLLDLAGSYIMLRDFAIRGGNGTAASYLSGQNGIGNAYSGALVAGAYSNVHIEGIEVFGFRDAGMKLWQLGANSKVIGNYSHNNGRIGLAFFSGDSPEISGNRIKDISPGAGGMAPFINTYGLSLSNDLPVAGLPPTRRPIVTHNSIEGIDTWQALDVHASEQAIVSHNQIEDAMLGIYISISSGSNNDENRLSSVIGNMLKTTTAYRRDGIILALGSIASGQGVGCVCQGNVIEGYGLSQATYDAYQATAAPVTKGAAISVVYGDDWIIQGNIIRDWHQRAIKVDGVANNGFIGGNVIGDGTASNGVFNAIEVSDVAAVTATIGRNNIRRTTGAMTGLHMAGGLTGDSKIIVEKQSMFGVPTPATADAIARMHADSTY